MSVRYISQKIHEQVRMDRFREALTRVHVPDRLDENLKDFGVTKPIEHDDIADLSHVYGGHIHKENLEEESVVTGQPVSDKDFAKSEPSALARILLSGERSEMASRAETVMSRTSSSISYETPEHPHKETEVSRSFHDQAMNKANNANPLIRDVNAVQMVMENIFDWDFHERHHGDTLTPQVLSRLMISLGKNLKATCPSVPYVAVLNLYNELIENRWLGDITNIRYITQGVIEACLEAQNGNPQPLEKVERYFRGNILFHERFYPAVRQDGKVPLRMLAAALERQGGRPTGTPPRP